MIQVIVFFHIRDGHCDTFLDEFRRVAPEVLAEEGCIEYGLSRDIDTGIERFAAARANVFTLFERWESLDALKAHLVTKHMNEFRKRINEYIERLDILSGKPIE